MGRRSDHSRDELREMALAAAKRIVAKQGYGALSTRKVAAAIGYTVGSLYLAFTNLEDLILQVNGSTLSDLHTALARTAEHCQDPDACIAALAEEYIRFAFENRALWSLIFEHPTPNKPPAWYSEKVARMFQMVDRPLKLLAPQRSDAEIHLAANALWGGVHGVSILGLAGRLDEVALKAALRPGSLLVTNFLIGFKQQAKTIGKTKKPRGIKR